MRRSQQHSKSKSLNISEQVKQILHSRGLSKVFNYPDYRFFERRCRKAFNKAQAIAELFISENEQDSDLNEYVF